MPPEQASGKIGEIGPTAEVYAVGAILYCLLTNRPPFQSANPMDTMRQVFEREQVLTRPVGPVKRCVKWARSRPTAAALVAVRVLAADLLLASGVWFTDQLRHERDSADAAHRTAHDREIAEREACGEAEGEKHRTQTTLADMYTSSG